jgi:peptide/nickel transport system ATP-binding protein
MQPPPLLSIDKLRIEDRRAHPVVDDVSLQLKAGDFLGIVGESGSGKTMLACAILRLLPDGLQTRSGRIALDGRDLLALSPSELRKVRGGSIGMVFQEPLLSLNPAMTIGAQMIEAQRMHLRLPKAELRRRAIDMLDRVKIRRPVESLAAFPHEFSGGMRQRIMLASVMMLRPKILIADEPTTALDTLSQREILDLMTELGREAGTAVMLITHNLSLVAKYASTALVMRNGRVVETGSSAQVLQAPSDPYTRLLVDSIPHEEVRPPIPDDAPVVMSVRGLQVRYRIRRMMLGPAKTTLAVDDVTLDIRQGEIVAVVGGSGSGKTSLGRCLMGLVDASAGTIQFEGMDMVRASRGALHAARLASQMVFQDPYSSLDPRMRVRSIILESLRHFHDLSTQERDSRVEKVLGQVGLEQFGDRYPHALSGGQKQRVAIARAIVRSPKFIVADEPISALDMTIQSQILTLLRNLQSSYGFACLFISHDLGAVRQIADQVVVMEHGRIVEQGACRQVFESPRHAYTKALLEASPAVGLQRISNQIIDQQQGAHHAEAKFLDT